MRPAPPSPRRKERKTSRRAMSITTAIQSQTSASTHQILTRKEVSHERRETPNQTTSQRLKTRLLDWSHVARRQPSRKISQGTQAPARPQSPARNQIPQ